MSPGKSLLNRLTIQQKLVLSAAVLALVAAMVGVVGGGYVVRALHDDARVHLEALADIEVDRLDQQLQVMAQKLERVTDDDVASDVALFQRSGSAAARERLRGHAGLTTVTHPGVRAVRIFDLRGRLIAGDALPAAGGNLRLARERALVDETLRMDATMRAGPVGRMDVGDQVVTTYLHAMTIPRDGTPVAVVVAECDFMPVSQLLGGGTRDDDGGTTDIHMVQRTPEGAEFITPLRFADGIEFTRAVPWSETEAPATRVLLASEPLTLTGVRDYRAKKVLAALRPIPNTNWGLVVKVDESEAFAVAHRISAVLLIGFFCTVGAMLAITLIVNQSVIRRIRNITASATQMSTGNFGVRVGDDRPDELGELSVAFDRMADTLARDMTRRELVESKLAHQARHDALTGLPNRARAEERLGTGLEARADRQVAVLFCDLDDFKTVNDELGHAAGDRLLRVVAQRFRAALRPTDMLARFGGDEFLVVCTEVAEEGEMEAVASRLQAALSEPVTIDHHEAFVSVSIGIALSGPESTAESMVRDADAAMYRAKELGRRRHVTHDEDIRARSAAGLTSSTDLRRAIADDRLVLAFQPIIDLQDNRLDGFESLVRWPRDGHLVPPSRFVPRAQELGLALDLDGLVIRRACRELARLRATGRTPWMSVNVSPQSIVEPGLERTVLAALEEHGVPATALVLEVTEQSLELAASGSMLESLVALRNRGVRVAVDDFGTGHSSLARLRHLPVDILKLDRLLIHNIDRDPRTREVTRAVIQLAATLEADVVAEGIEQDTQRVVLADLGCRWGQGFAIGRPEIDPDDAKRGLADLGVALT